jgi:hypothetical protein
MAAPGMPFDFGPRLARVELGAHLGDDCRSRHCSRCTQRPSFEAIGWWPSGEDR